jgi:hypothetical protein
MFDLYTFLRKKEHTHVNKYVYKYSALGLREKPWNSQERDNKEQYTKSLEYFTYQDWTGLTVFGYGNFSL